MTLQTLLFLDHSWWVFWRLILVSYLSSDEHDPGNTRLLEASFQLVEDVREGKTSLNDAIQGDCITKLHSEIDKWRDSMQQYRTAKLWLQFQETVAIMRMLIFSARTGLWGLYLQALHRMLPLLSSVGHNNYTKSLMIFLAKMAALPESHPHVHRAFENGLHVVRRTDNFWAGIFTDLHIEQVWTIQHHEYYGQLSNNKYSH